MIAQQFPSGDLLQAAVCHFAKPLVAHSRSEQEILQNSPQVSHRWWVDQCSSRWKETGRETALQRPWPPWSLQQSFCQGAQEICYRANVNKSAFTDFCAGAAAVIAAATTAAPPAGPTLPMVRAHLPHFSRLLYRVSSCACPTPALEHGLENLLGHD